MQNSSRVKCHYSVRVNRFHKGLENHGLFVNILIPLIKSVRTSDLHLFTFSSPHLNTTLR